MSDEIGRGFDGCGEQNGGEVQAWTEPEQE
jgi:hypothetical protein